MLDLFAFSFKQSMPFGIVGETMTKALYPKGCTHFNDKCRSMTADGVISKIKSRPASERANSTLKEDLKILEKLRILNQERANILAQIASVVLLLIR